MMAMSIKRLRQDSGDPQPDRRAARYLSRSMKGRLATAALPALAALALLATGIGAAAPPRPPTPKGFFGIAPQTQLTDADAAYMRAGGIESVRWPLVWSAVQPEKGGAYDWSAFDEVVAVASRRGLQVLPFFFGTPSWAASEPTTLPVSAATGRAAWAAFVRAAVERYGPGGTFWVGSPSPRPIRIWQVWNEANFFYFAYPVSPPRYARLLDLTQRAIRSVDRRAKVVLSGLFGDPDEGGVRGMDATRFLAALYRVPGVKADFDAVALHPYAFHVDDLEALTEGMREVILRNRDARTPLYVTEMGWGSQNDPQVVAFEQGIAGQARELRKAYRYLIANRRALNLKGAYWYSWKDNPEYTACSFCDSVGLFRAGRGFKPKPAWRAFVALTGGRARP
jgi:hypothetical protein